MYVSYVCNHLAVLPECSNMMGTPITQAYKGTYVYNILARMQKIKSMYTICTYQQRRFHLVASFHQQFYSSIPMNTPVITINY